MTSIPYRGFTISTLINPEIMEWEWEITRLDGTVLDCGTADTEEDAINFAEIAIDFIIVS